MIKSFKDNSTAALFLGQYVRRIDRNIQRQVKKKLDMLNAATQLIDLLTPPGNRLEPLAGNRLGQHSIRVNRQWRICFNWVDGHAENVEFCDYH